MRRILAIHSKRKIKLSRINCRCFGYHDQVRKELSVKIMFKMRVMRRNQSYEDVRARKRKRNE